MRHEARLDGAALFRVRGEVATMNKRAGKLGLGALVLTEGPPEVETIPDPLGLRDLKRTVYPVTIEGEAVKLAGWRLLAVLDHTLSDGAPIVRWVPGEEEAGAVTGLTTTASACDHCGTARRRNETFVLRHDDGRRTRVGRQCLADFLGHASPEAILQAATWAAWASRVGEDGDPDAWGPSAREVIQAEPVEVLAWTVSIARLDGFLSRKAADERGGQPTSGDVDAALWPPTQPTEEFRRWIRARVPGDEDRERARAIVAWAVGVSPGFPGDYLDNLRKVAGAEVVRPKHLGLLCSAYAGHGRAREKAARTAAARKAGADRRHFGEVKKRTRGLRVTVLRRPTWESEWGPCALFVLQASAAEWAIWRTSNLDAMEEGRSYTVDATVKAHQTDKFGNPETVLTRVTVKTDHGEAGAA